MRFIAMFLCCALTLGLFGCSTEKKTEAAPKTFQVGYARVSITPNYSVPLGGYGKSDQRMSQGFLNYQYATCIAVTDADDSTVLLIGLDAGSVPDFTVEPTKKAITEATGIAPERILLNATHTHSGVDLTYTSTPAIQKFLPEYYANIAQAAKEALADRSPATMETGAGYTENLNFVRNYTTSSGELYGDNLALNGTITGHTSEPDNQIQLIRFVRAAKDKKDILAVNWQAHPKLDSTAETPEGVANRPMLSADFVGVARDYVEANSDVLFAFYLGAAGNLNPISKIPGEHITTDCKVYGDLLGGHIIQGMESLKPVEKSQMKVTLTQRHCEAIYDHSEDHKLDDAKKIQAAWAASDVSTAYASAMAAVPDAEIYSPYHAFSIISRSRQTAYSKSLELNAVRIGNVAVATFPYEMFDVNAMFVKDNSPFDTTFILSLCNGNSGYLAAEYAFQGKGIYETQNRSFERGTAENMANNMVEMLKSLE